MEEMIRHAFRGTVSERASKLNGVETKVGVEAFGDGERAMETAAMLAAAGEGEGVAGRRARRVVGVLYGVSGRNERRRDVGAVRPRKGKAKRVYDADAKVDAWLGFFLSSVNAEEGLAIPSPYAVVPPPRASKSHRLLSRRENKAKEKERIAQFLRAHDV